MELNISDMLFAVINFLVMAFLLTKLLYKPVNNILERRQEQVEEVHNHAVILQREAEILFQKSEEEIFETGKKAQEIINQAVRSGEETKAGIIEDGKAIANKMLMKARDEIEHEKEKMRVEIREEVAVLSVMVAESILKNTISRKDHEKLIHDFISEYRRQKQLEKFNYMGRGPIEAEVYSAVEMTEDQMDALATGLEEHFGTEVIMKMVINEDIIGGLMIKVGDVVFDGTVANKMFQMEEQFLMA